jgi:hypothetical protein
MMGTVTPDQMFKVEPVPALPLPPHALVYDELPAGSDVRREYRGDGTVTITAPAGEPSAASRLAAAQSTGVSSAALCGVALLVVLWVGLTLSPATGLNSGGRALATVLFAVFCGGVFLLVWKVRYDGRLDLLSKARKQAAVLHATPWRLYVETAGPGGDKSYEIVASDLRRLHVIGEPLCADGAGAAESVPCLKMELADGATVRLLQGRHPAEIRWVAATLEHSLIVNRVPLQTEPRATIRALWRLGLW